MTPPRGFGGVEIPPRDVPAVLEQLQIEIERLTRRSEELENRVMELEDGQRPSHLDADFEQRVLAALTKNQSSHPPDSHAEVKTASGYRLHAPMWGFLLALLLVLAIAMVWKSDDLADLIHGSGQPPAPAEPSDVAAANCPANSYSQRSHASLAISMVENPSSNLIRVPDMPLNDDPILNEYQLGPHCAISQCKWSAIIRRNRPFT